LGVIIATVANNGQLITDLLRRPLITASLAPSFASFSACTLELMSGLFPVYRESGREGLR